ncbi:MAG: CotH kinase family protein [Clostridia bacterium]|nr:CotH kinase family protein [Clostridia bacterium]
MKKFTTAFVAVLMALSVTACSACDIFGVSNGDNNNNNNNNSSNNNNNSSNNNNNNNNNNNDNNDNNDNNNNGNEDTDGIITFSAGQGLFADGKSSIKVNPDGNGKVTFDGEPRLDGYAFAGWYSGEEQFDVSSSYTEEQTFTAKYVYGGEDAVYTALFEQNAQVGIDIDMSDKEWKKLNQDYKDFADKGGKSPIYRLADSVTVTIDGLNYYYEEVGVRMKGNTSRHEFYGDNGFFNNVHMKLSFKQTFDDPDDGYTQDELKKWDDQAKRDERKARTLGGMEKIDIKYNSTADETYVREMYAMKMFRDNGIYAPNVTLCSLTALEKDGAKKNLGVYRIHEPVDEAFISRRTGEKKVGDLWKCTYSKKGPADLTNCDLDNRVGVEDELKGKFYSYDKKTNKKKDKVTGLRDLSSIKDFIAAINNEEADFDSLIDVDYFAKFEAVNYVLGNPDCIRNNYNNYYLYFRADGKAIIIPYDYDRCLGITKDWNPTGSANMYVKPYTRTVAANGEGQNNPLYKYLIDKGAPYGEGSVLMKYRQNLLDLTSNEGFTTSAFNAYKDSYKARYAKYTATAISSNGLSFDDNNIGNVSYQQYIETKFQTLNEHIDKYRAED